MAEENEDRKWFINLFNTWIWMILGSLLQIFGWSVFWAPLFGMPAFWQDTMHGFNLLPESVDGHLNEINSENFVDGLIGDIF